MPLFPRRCRKWANRRGRAEQGVFSGPIEGLPELIDVCGGKESVFAAIVGQQLHHSQVSQVGPCLAEVVARNGWKKRGRKKKNSTINNTEFLNEPFSHLKIWCGIFGFIYDLCIGRSLTYCPSKCIMAVLKNLFGFSYLFI